MASVGEPIRWETTRDLSRRLQIPERTLRQWRYLGMGPPYSKFGKHVRYDPAAVALWEASHVVLPRSA